MDLKTEIEKAETLYNNQDFKQAAEIYSSVLISNRKSADIYEARSMCYFHIEQYDLSLADMNEARQLEPNNPYRYSSRAFLKSKMGDIDGAIADYEKAIHLDPDDAISHNNLGLLQEQKGYWQQSEASFNQADKLASIETHNSTQLSDEIIGKEKEEQPTTESEILKYAVTTRSGLKEFLHFIKNGFKLKE